VIDWTPEGGSRRWACQSGHGRIHVEKIMQEMGVSGSDTHEAMEALPVIVLNGDNSSPSAAVGTGGPKSK